MVTSFCSGLLLSWSISNVQISESQLALQKSCTRDASAEYFEELGFAVIGKHPHKGSAAVQLRIFKSWFGARPEVCLSVWRLLEQAGFLKKKKMFLIHPLIGLYFLKNYCPADKGTSDLGCDVKTYRKWPWLIVKSLAKLDKNVVSIICCFV